ncbi:protein of unknown function (DUF4385) [Rubrobacter radiotolerans]|uniref:DUF4385 domain-containing protein n=1 Tax=Rubrobacter radiotolerans TaxID=42256 RepID=A0A023X133_RUBRA|nr:DUF4385 domain-containing protein [Rubrobacter radiotolerans]AHY46023.1 protein of unknown function (DUF4385) [Rubrobacter radiotolerans]MDX5893435.1 DUF4385 domain-containing protein [Rubrobacter radiotolerans]SMC03732.1 protein of unknown function [Rubrobacter radiotolerans DSM 5868]
MAKKDDDPEKTRKSGADFDYSLDYKNLDLRKNPELYRVGKGEQGVLMVEPYKSEILPNWRFKTEEIARESSQKILAQFYAYRDADDFVGMDMARKFLQMGYTRARRYANHASGKKYEAGEVRAQEPDALDNEKARAARVFYEKYVEAREDPYYKKRRKAWVEWSKEQG